MIQTHKATQHWHTCYLGRLLRYCHHSPQDWPHLSRPLTQAKQSLTPILSQSTQHSRTLPPQCSTRFDFICTINKALLVKLHIHRPTLEDLLGRDLLRPQRDVLISSPQSIQVSSPFLIPVSSPVLV